MRKAEERAKDAFPKSDWFNENRSAYIKGYEQAVKDLIAEIEKLCPDYDFDDEYAVGQRVAYGKMLDFLKNR